LRRLTPLMYIPYPTRLSSDLIRVWPVDSVEPDVWHNDRTITDTPIAAGRIGTTVSTFAGNTNVSPTIRIRDYQVENVQEMTVTRDRKSTRLNSSHVKMSYAVF